MILLIFPHQLFAKHPALKRKQQPSRIILLEDSLFFGDKRYPAEFHQQKLWLHRATMKRYEASLAERGFETQYLDYDPKKSLQEQLERAVKKKDRKGETFVCSDPTDFMLEKRLRAASESMSMDLEFLANPGFLNSCEQNQAYRQGKKRWFMADFYKWQRQRLDVLMEDDEPAGGQWSFDEDNRKKVPKKLLSTVPENMKVKRDAFDREAKEYVESRFCDRPGNLKELFYPTSHTVARRWLKHFLANRFENFGNYEDAIVEGESWLWHSVLTPSMNIGLLTPDEVVKETLKFAGQNDVPLNSLEGFLRQVIGWREFMRATYEDLGVQMRTTNHWQHHREMP
ncbi:MAG: cryptochrome/photolyase family protein, partial [Planctomycetota bacterium]